MKNDKYRMASNKIPHFGEFKLHYSAKHTHREGAMRWQDFLSIYNESINYLLLKTRKNEKTNCIYPHVHNVYCFN